MQDVGGHPNRGQGGAQLVGDIGDEPALDAGEVLELADLALQVGGHLVERRRQPGQIVLAPDQHPLLQPSRGEALGYPRGHPYRRDHRPGDDPRDGADQQDQGDAGHQQGAPHELEGALLLVEGEQEIELVRSDVGDLHARAHRDAGDRRASLVGHLHRCPALPAGVVEHLLAQGVRDVPG